MVWEVGKNVSENILSEYSWFQLSGWKQQMPPKHDAYLPDHVA
jgi:hypothetical protein